MDCVRCGAGTWAASNSPFGRLCLSCLYRTRTTGVVAHPPRQKRVRLLEPPKPQRPCICARDEACDVCYAAKDAAMDAATA